MIEMVDIKLVELIQTSGVGALMLLILVRYVLDYALGKRGTEARDAYRAKIDKMDGKLDALVTFVSNTKKKDHQNNPP